jgi:hypothetical protein
MKNKKLIIIAGAAGEIGTTYCESFLDGKNHVLGVIRNKKVALEHPSFEQVVCELTSSDDIERAFNNVDLEDYEEVVYLHTIGTDKFDPRGYPSIQKMNTIDLSVYDTNVNSFKYLMRYLVKKLSGIRSEKGNAPLLKLLMIGGVSDKYAPFVIESFCEAKYIIRQYIQSQISIHPEWVCGGSVNVTSTITASALAVRPFAQTTYWLTPQEVVRDSMEFIRSLSKGYEEKDLIKYSPQFLSGYYENNDALYKKWSKETGIY